ncbi:evolutionarily conserved signaling intermediate in Toll pathway, mitochondrial [Lampris incognitus]|uniref:evolutionarily conserved signaling intermediate in Toll pathway, mitochondrial n=1 Tax=Lampris incognitus TaxID=2546036 RepID=UPI0024B57D4D|nr:evolutionarily conserved signaling intermediate in Toll pathway, mitochondrial [Lampris incognitus]XP_056156754.1 evolutionarily conserved signaling intermediate in Toll pathway, mitochondrial [Lampris incognitus]XP_056156755.1 evolutionarily conserved signaling intermediate in Toll pathway, mitochondrial [Lampris incognitus]
MNCARRLSGFQGLKVLLSSVRWAHQYAALLQSSSAMVTSVGVLCNTHGQMPKHFHGSPAYAKKSVTAADFRKDDEGKKDKSLVIHDDLFERAARETKTKATFNKVVNAFIKRDIRRRGHVEFIYAALKKMPEFGVEKDLAVYNKLLDVFPKEVFVPRNYIQRMFNHYPRQQECGIQVLEQMESYGIMPNVETKVLLVQIFGEKSHPMRKFQRLMYWFPKFKHTNPYPIPYQLPEDPVDLARFSLTRIASDLDAKVTVYQMPFTDITEAGEEISHPYIVGTQSPDQIELLAKHDASRPVFVEGPFPLWLRKTCVYYYILRADPLPPEEKVEEPYDPERCFDYPLQLDLDLERDLGEEEEFDVDDLDEGPVFALCMTSHGDQATLNQWISNLQQTNPILGRVPTLFRLDAGQREVQRVVDPGPDHGYQKDSETDTKGREEQRFEQQAETDNFVEEKPQQSQRVKQ